MQQYEVKVRLIDGDTFVKVWADNKAKATYKAFTMCLGNGLERYCKFGDFLKYFYGGIKQIN